MTRARRERALREAVEIALQALTQWRGHNAGSPPTLGVIDSTLVATDLLPVDTLPLVAHLREERPEWDDAQAGELITQSDNLLAQAATVLDMAARDQSDRGLRV